MRTLNQADLPYRPQFGPHITSCIARSPYTPEAHAMRVFVYAALLFFVFCIATFIMVPMSGWLLETSGVVSRGNLESVAGWLGCLTAFGVTVFLACAIIRRRPEFHDNVPLELFEGGIHLTTKLRSRRDSSSGQSDDVTAQRWATRSWRLLKSVKLLGDAKVDSSFRSIELHFTDGERIEIHQDDDAGCETVIQTLLDNFGPKPASV